MKADQGTDVGGSPEPKLGWAALSRSRLNRAEAQLVEGTEGVRDEVGVLALHTGYSNRFFPGTSTQQTRLRYALFVPWQIRDLLRSKMSVVQARVELAQREIQLANRLRGQGVGVIGAENAKLGRPVAIPPSSAYWVALRAWGIVNAMPGGVEPSRNDVFGHWDKWYEGRAGRGVTDDEGRELDIVPRLFTNGLPEARRAWRGRGPLNFELRDEERRFLRARLAETTRWFDGKPSLLAALVGTGVVPTDGEHLWSRRITQRADTADRKAIERARRAASLSVVARALYGAAVETLQENDGMPRVTDTHRGHLEDVVAVHGARASSLRLDDLAADGIVLAEGLLQMLGLMQEWITHDGNNPLELSLHRGMVDWEMRRKGSRSKLPGSQKGREARRAWEDRRTAVPIGYRWPLVKGLLRDLGGTEIGV